MSKMSRDFHATKIRQYTTSLYSKKHLKKIYNSFETDGNVKIARRKQIVFISSLSNDGFGQMVQ